MTPSASAGMKPASMPTRRTPPSFLMWLGASSAVALLPTAPNSMLLRPEAAVLALEALHGAADVGRALGLALLVDHGRQIARDAHRLHGIEEVEAIAAEQILDVVLRGRDDDVEAGLIHQSVEALAVERRRFGGNG